MELRWWPLGLAGVVVVLIVIAVAVWLPLPPAARMLRPLAHVKRLTELPSYRRVAALQFWSSIVTLVLLVVLFGATIFTSSRPVGFASATRNFDALHPEDVMVCVGEPVTDATTAGFLNYYSEQIKTYNTERIGLTSPTLRVVPLTRDYVYAGQKFADYAKLAGLKRDLDSKKQISDADVTALNNGIDDFSRPIDYTDYAQSTEDVLALCMAGFPSFEDKSTRRRSLIYLGYTDFRGSGEQRPSLFSTQQIKDMASKAGVQINGIARTDVVGAEHANDSLASIADTTGGTFSVYNPAGTAAGDGTDPTLAGLLDKIEANPPSVALPSGTMLTQRTWDYPNLPLTVSILVAAILCLSLAVLRR